MLIDVIYISLPRDRLKWNPAAFSCWRERQDFPVRARTLVAPGRLLTLPASV